MTSAVIHRKTSEGPLEVLMIPPGITAAELIEALKAVSPDAQLTSLQGYSKYQPGSKGALRFRGPR